MTEKNKSLQEWVREDKLLLVEDASGKQSLYKQSANTNDKLLLYVAETAQEMKNYFRTRNVGAMPDVVQEAFPNIDDDEIFYKAGGEINDSGSLTKEPDRPLMKAIRRQRDTWFKHTLRNEKEPAVAGPAKINTEKTFNLGDTDVPSAELMPDQNWAEEPLVTSDNTRGRRVTPPGHGPDEAKEKDMSNRLEEASMFQGGPDNMTTGNPPMDYRTYLAAELFGSTSFASQAPTADTHQAQVVTQGEQAVEGMGVLRPSGAPANNMYEQSISNQLIKLTKNLFRAGKLDEAAKIADALEQPQNAAAFVLEAAMATDGSVDESLTEDLYRTAAILNNLQEG